MAVTEATGGGGNRGGDGDGEGGGGDDGGWLVTLVVMEVEAARVVMETARVAEPEQAMMVVTIDM